MWQASKIFEAPIVKGISKMASVPERCRLSSRLAHVIVTVELLVASVPCQAQPDTTVQVVSATSLRGKILCGYQGWFRCPGDAAKMGWIHWSRDRNRIAPSTLTFEMWPDMSEYAAGGTLSGAGFHAIPTAGRRSCSAPTTPRRCCVTSSG